MTNKNWLVHFKGNETLALRFDDQVASYERTGRNILTPFLDETQQHILKKVVGNRVPLSFFGGYDGAERKRACIGEAEDFEIVQLSAKLSQFDKVTHSDCMGALYNCGCRNDYFGDILVDEKIIRVFVCLSIASFVRENCTSIRRSKICFKEDDSVVENIRTIEYFQKIVMSERLDSLVSACTNLSRAKAQSLIRGKCVKVNHVVLEETSFLCNNDSILSIRGHGRFVFKQIVKHTKSGKMVVKLGKYK